jgi:hypothetical protein
VSLHGRVSIASSIDPARLIYCEQGNEFALENASDYSNRLDRPLGDHIVHPRYRAAPMLASPADDETLALVGESGCGVSVNSWHVG